SRWFALSRIATAKARDGQFEEALKIARSINSGFRRANALESIVKILASAGHVDAALEVTRETDDSFRRTLAWRSIVATSVNITQITTALEIAHDIKDLDDRARAVSGIASAWMRVGETAKSLATFDVALKTIREAKRHERDGILAIIAGDQSQVAHFGMALKT